MKRLSWVTFIFLPAMFASSLFGMNVDLLKNDPSWLWYLLFGGVLFSLSFAGWLLCKYFPVEKWAEYKVDKFLHRRHHAQQEGELEGEEEDDSDQFSMAVLPR